MLGHVLRVRREVGHVGRNARRGDAERAGDREQRQVRIVGGQRVVRPVRAADPGGAGEQIDERRLCLHQHPRAHRREIAREADELQRVPQPLLGGENDRLAVRVRAVPARPGRRGPIPAELRNREPPIVLAPSFGELPMGEQRESEVPVRLREVGDQRKRAAKRGDRAGQIVHRLPRETEIVPRHRVIGLQRQRALVRGDRVARSIRGEERKAEIVVELRLLRNQRDGAIEQRQRIGGAVALIQDDAEVMQRMRMLRRDGERGAIVGLRRIEAAALMRVHRARDEGIRCGRRGRSRRDRGRRGRRSRHGNACSACRCRTGMGRCGRSPDRARRRPRLGRAARGPPGRRVLQRASARQSPTPRTIGRVRCSCAAAT